MALMVAIWFDVIEVPETTLTVHLVSDVLRSLAVWATMLGFVGLAQRYWNTRSRLWRYSAEAAYPFYILHQTVILLLAYLVVQLGWGVPLKYALLVFASLTATLLAYDLLVRRWGPVRFLFGMKPARQN